LAGLLIGLLIGGLTGAVTMLLVAPQSGKRTRAKLYRQGAEWREQAADSMGDAVASAHDKACQIPRREQSSLRHWSNAAMRGSIGKRDISARSAERRSLEEGSSRFRRLTDHAEPGEHQASAVESRLCDHSRR
jgi:gas vesicle protein